MISFNVLYLRGLNMLEIPQIYSNFVTDLSKFFVSHWVPETSKVL